MRTLLLIVFGLISFAASAYDFEVDGIYYTITSPSNLEVEVTHSQRIYHKANYYDGRLLSNNSQYISEWYTNTTYTGNIIVPGSVNYNNRTYKVTSIGEYAFGGNLVKQGQVSGKDGYRVPVNEIGCDVTTVSIPGTVTIIRKGAFENCHSLIAVNMVDNSVITIEPSAFDNSGLEHLTLPNSVTSIGDKAFYGIESLSSVTFGRELATIGYLAFSNCTSLSSIIIPDSTTEISTGAFAYCNTLTSVQIGTGMQQLSADCFKGCGKLMEVFFKGESVPVVGLNAFSSCHSALTFYVPTLEGYESALGASKCVPYLQFDGNNFVYTGLSPRVTATNNLRGYKASIEDAALDIAAGAHTAYFTVTYGDELDFSVRVPFNYTIQQAPMTLTVQDVQREYGDANPAFTCDIAGFVNGENEQSLGVTPTFECEATPLSNVGTYRVLAALDAPNYDITYKYGTLTIIKAPITVSVVNASMIYGDSNPAFTLSYNGLKNNESEPAWNIKPTIKTTATKTSPVGEYEAIASNGDAKNYDITSYLPGVLTIGKRNLTAKANDCERLYGEDNPAFMVSYVGFVNNENESALAAKPIAECTATKESNSGSYPITVSGGSAENYAFVYQDGRLTVKPLTVGFKNVYSSVTYDDMSVSTSDSHFNFLPTISGPFSEDDFWIELWFLDGDNRYDNHVATIAGGDYAGNYVNTNYNRTMYAGKYIFNLTSKGTNPNVVANPSRAYVTVNRASTNLEWTSNDPIIVGVGEKVDLGISYQADLWCDFSTYYDEELFTLSSVGERSRDPHWYAIGLKEGQTTLNFGITCKKNDMGFYDFSNPTPVSRLIRIEMKEGAINDVEADCRADRYVVYNLQGIKVLETGDESRLKQLPHGLYIINGRKVSM